MNWDITLQESGGWGRDGGGWGIRGEGVDAVHGNKCGLIPSGSM